MKYKSKFLNKAKNDPNILIKLGVDNLDYFLENYNQPERYYHNFNHIDEVIYAIEQYTLTKYQYKILLITALYHDIVYDSKNNSNELLSTLYLENLNIPLEDKITIKNLILFTKYNNNPKNDLEEIFMCCDMHIFEDDFKKQLEFETAIQKEYAWVPLKTYISERIKILTSIGNMYYENQDNLLINTQPLINYLKTKKWNIGIYAGSFNPLHIGHYDVIKQAEKIFDKVILLKSSDNNIILKSGTAFNITEFKELDNFLKNREVYEISDLIIDDLNKFKDLGNVTLIRGLRNSSDLLYEQNYLQVLQDIDSSISTTYFMTKPKYAHVSSSMIRELYKIDKKLVKHYLKF